MQENQSDSIMCRVKSCPAVASPKSHLRYCPIHNMVASESATFQLALKGKMGSILKAFAEDLDRGYYPKGF